jgi:hypothetical protein
MTLGDFLSQKRQAILTLWFDTIVETYPPETAKFLRSQKNQFANPVGSTILQGIEGVFDALIEGGEPQKVSPFLDNIIRIRAVQDFTASQAVSFIFSLKTTIRDSLGAEIAAQGLTGDLLLLESRIDDLALMTFDIYMKCREKIYDLKANEARKMTFRLIERMNRLDEGQK